MLPSFRTAATSLLILLAGFAGGLSVGAARGDELVAQVIGPANPPPQPRPSGIPGIDAATVERIVSAAVAVAVERATNTAIDRVQRAIVPSELSSLRQQLGTVERITSEITALRRSIASWLMWGAAGLFGLLVLASVVGGTIVALLFRNRRA